MSVQSEIDRIITAVGNAYSKVSEKGGTVPASQTVANLATAIGSIPAGAAKETWVIKSDASGEFATTQISFTSNGQKFTSIGANNSSGSFIILRYDNNEVAGYDPGAGSYGYEFDNDAYRKLTFDTPPAGALLTWLQSNATKQPDDTAVQDTKALTITSNGTVSVTPDVPYDGLSSVDVTVNVSGGYNLKKITNTWSANKLLKDITITHNCGSIPKFVIVTSSNSNANYLMAGSGANESQTSSFSMVINTVNAKASVTSTTFTYNNAGSMRYYNGTKYTYYFFY